LVTSFYIFEIGKFEDMKPLIVDGFGEGHYQENQQM
jgi:hypothetical protein